MGAWRAFAACCRPTDRAGCWPLATLINTFGNGLFFTVSVVYFTLVVGLSARELGIGLVAAGIAGILAGVPAGHLADRVGAREVMIGLTLVSAVFMSCFALVQGFQGFVVVGCLYAFFDRGAGAVRQALIAAVVSGDSRVRTRAYLRSVTNVGIGLGSLVAGVVLAIDVRPAYVALILVNAATFVVAASLVARLPHQAPVPREEGAPRLPVFRDRPYLAFCVLYGIATIQFGILEVAVPLWVVQDTLAPTWTIAAVLFLNTAIVAVFQVRASRGTEEVTPAAAAVRTSGWIVLAACAIFAAASGRGAVAATLILLLGALVHVVGEMRQSAGGWGVAFGLAPDHLQGQYQGLFSTAHGVVARLRAAADDRAADHVRDAWLDRARSPHRRGVRGCGAGRPVGAVLAGRDRLMAGAPPEGEPVPTDGALPSAALEGLGERPFGFYLHVPYCTTRCGYCDFNTYTAAELGGGASQSTYVDQAIAELRLARRVLGTETCRPRRSSSAGARRPCCRRATWATAAGRPRGVRAAPGAEVTTEANPDSVTPESLAALRAAGFTRMSFGMQSAATHVLATLDRTHTPGRAVAAVAEAKAAGFEHVNLDLIYGTPGESLGDWAGSLDAALAAGAGPRLGLRADHRGRHPALGAHPPRGAPAPDDDDLADKYQLADERLEAAGLRWYEVSNWATDPAAECRHNQLYWTGADWWGVGPGAHSHVGGTRWWNVRHPSAYAERLGAGVSPGQAREVLDDETRRVERVLLEIRLRSGLPMDVLDAAGRAAAADAVEQGLITVESATEGRAVLTRRGRLLADAVVRSLV